MKSIIEWNAVMEVGFPKRKDDYLVVHKGGGVEILYFSNDIATDYNLDEQGHLQNSVHEHYKGFIWENDEGAIFEQTDVLYWAELPKIRKEEIEDESNI